MTEEFERWCEEGFPEAFLALRKGRYAVEHFWLTRIFAEIEREASNRCTHQGVSGDTKPCWTCLGRDFEVLKTRFGLGGTDE